MTIATQTQLFGFICPTMFAGKWDRNECTVEPEAGSTSFIILDHSLQTPIYRGKSRDDCQRFLGEDYANREDPIGAWLLDLAEESGQMVMCIHCGEWYWTEDGHPEGTLCPKFGVDVQKPPVKADPGMIECKNHPGTFYWWEDLCTLCETEYPE